MTEDANERFWSHEVGKTILRDDEEQSDKINVRMKPTSS